MELHINTYGAYLHVSEGMFEVKLVEDGQTRKQQVAAHKVKRVFLGKGTSLSAESVALALRHNVDILFIENDGTPLARVWHGKLGSTTKIRKRQLEASLGAEGLAFTKEWVGKKLHNQAAFLTRLIKHREHQKEYLEGQAARILGFQQKIAALEGDTADAVADSLRGFEGNAGKIYFESLGELLSKNYAFDGRSFRPAKDPFNAFLNYAYGVLYSLTEKALIVAGVDPFTGFLHRDDYNHKSMVFDFIEPYRIFAEAAVFGLFSAKSVNKSHTDEITNGYSLNQEGKKLLMARFNEYMQDEKVRHDNRNLGREQILQSGAHSFANALINC